MRYFVIFASVCLMLAWASVATAQVPGVGGNLGSPPSIDETYTSGIIGSEGNPIGIILDPNAGPWKKTFLGVGGGQLIIDEWLGIAGPPAWTDWDELILTPNWIWTAAQVVTPDQGILNGTISTKFQPNDFVVFNFNPPEMPGTKLHVTKTLTWSGGLPVPQNATVIVEQWPTPEPGTIVLLTTGLLALGLGYIRRRK
jgi:hypothetical protein